MVIFLGSGTSAGLIGRLGYLGIKATRIFGRELRERQHRLEAQQAKLAETTTARIAMLEDTVDSFKEQHSNIKELADRLQDEREKMQIELEDIRRKLDEAAKGMAAKTEVISTLKGEVLRLEEENRTQAGTIAELRAQIDALHQRVSELNVQQAVVTELHNAQQDINNAQQGLNNAQQRRNNEHDTHS